MYTTNSSEQTIEQIEVIQEVALPEVSMMNDVVIKKTRSSLVFSKRNTLEKWHVHQTVSFDVNT